MINVELSRKSKSTLMIFTDIFLVTLSLWLAFTLRFGVWFWPNNSQVWLFSVAPILALPIFIKFGFYKTVVRFMGQKALVETLQATGLLVLLWVFTVATFLPFYLGIKITFPRFVSTGIIFPHSIPILFWINLFLTIGGSRQIAKLILLTPKIRPANKKNRNVLIYGGGMGGIELATSLSQQSDINILGIIDDDRSLKNHFIQDLKVLGDREEIEKIRSKSGALEILLAIPSMNLKQRKELLKFLEDKDVSIRTMPSLNELASGKAKMSDLQKIDITELLGRDEVAPNKNLLKACITEKNVLVTGAGGSIGSELCRQILSLAPSNLVLLDHSEYSLYLIHQELSNIFIKINSKTTITPILGSITNKDLIDETISNFNIETIYHAAAYKHVTLLEHNIKEGIINNIIGTYIVIKTAIRLKVKNFILISTDKAVRPTSVMGATKRISELITQGLAKKQNKENKKQDESTNFSIVRFGNVLGSSGSVIPLFRKQIADGGPITITHAETTRYFMTISEASQLVIQAGSIGGNCNVFLLNMGSPVSILSLAKQMIFLSGHKLKSTKSQEYESGIEIKFIGLSKGEKIHEELFTNNNYLPTEHPMITKAQENFFSDEDVEKILKDLESTNKLNQNDLRNFILNLSQK
jgi:UDP-N-acetylglucosamine 4,6-dehydratase